MADLCGEDNADALSHHEVLLPGTLLSKFVSDKLAECLAIFKRQVCFLLEWDPSCHTKPGSTSHASSIYVGLYTVMQTRMYNIHNGKQGSMPVECLANFAPGQVFSSFGSFTPNQSLKACPI